MKSGNKWFVYLCIVLSTLSAALLFWIHQIWPLLIGIPATLYLHKHKASSKEEQEQRMDMENKAFAGWLLLPVGVFMLFFLYLLIFRLIPLIAKSWQ